MTGRLVRIDEFQAEKEFDLLFDEFFKEDKVVFEAERRRFGYEDHLLHLEAGSAAEESDEVYVPDEQVDPQQAERHQVIIQVAQELRSLGDKYSEQYGSDMAKANSTLTTLFKQVVSLEYDTFKNTVESLQTHDRNAADFAFVMCLSRHVVSNVGNLANKAKNYFRRYIGQNYIGPIAEAGGVEKFVRQ